MAKFKAGVLINPYGTSKTFRMADGSGASNQLTKLDNGKLLRLKGDSQYGLCAQGDEIEAVLNVAEDLPPADGYNLGSLDDSTRFVGLADGLQATAGTGAIAIGDAVVCGTVVARGTSLGSVAPKVCKATAAATGIVFVWRVIAFLDTNGAVGQRLLIERV